MSKIANIVYTEYLRKLMAMRAAVVDITQAIVNKASTNPPAKGKKQKLLDAVYLEHNKNQQLVVWSYGPGGKACMGPFYPTLEAYPLQSFLDRLLFMLQVDKLAETPADWMPEHFGVDSIKKVRDEYGTAATDLKQTGRQLAKTIVGNDQALPSCLTRGQQPDESYAILYLNDGSGGACPGESNLIRLSGERPTEDVDNYEFFLRVYLHAQRDAPVVMAVAEEDRLFTPAGRMVIVEALIGARACASMSAEMDDRVPYPKIVYKTDGEVIFSDGKAMTDEDALATFKQTQALVLGRF
jgi:hypothetical protein